MSALPTRHTGLAAPVIRWALALALALAGCGGDDTSSPACSAGERSLAFVAPLDGAALTAADDQDPAMGALQYDVRARACGVDPAVQVGLYLLEPVDTGYAFTTAGDGTVVFPDVPLVPGNLRMQLRTVAADPVQSDVIAITVSL